MPHALPCAMEFGFLAKVFKIGILKESASEHLLKGMKRHCDKKQKNVMIQTKHCDGWFESSHCFKSIIAMVFPLFNSLILCAFTLPHSNIETYFNSIPHLVR